MSFGKMFQRMECLVESTKRTIKANKFYVYSIKHDSLEECADITAAKKLFNDLFKEFDKDGSKTIIASGKDLANLKPNLFQVQ